MDFLLEVIKVFPDFQSAHTALLYIRDQDTIDRIMNYDTYTSQLGQDVEIEDLLKIICPEEYKNSSDFFIV